MVVGHQRISAQAFMMGVCKVNLNVFVLSKVGGPFGFYCLLAGTTEKGRPLLCTLHCESAKMFRVLCAFNIQR